MKACLFVLAALAAVATAMPRYALVPMEELPYAPPRLRVARAAQQYDRDVYQPEPSELRPARQAGHPGGYGDQVDYGAYTGGYGAFGWYADYPVYSYDKYHR
ncbi:uncharacterized protein LOC122389649 [Amphibalanus amphitrite]|uniref:uncharacterized protein LOC122389649 n=1 Tax=Amphibalanus amphitrite TaxID=1232801 RepID=UPI001C924558|nr:uncharacterized protein LOC122389649 [Amphibalanus amphitrite]